MALEALRPEEAVGTDLAKNGREALYAVTGLYLAVVIAAGFLHPLMCVAVPVTFFPLTGYLAWQVFWARRTGPVILERECIVLRAHRRSLYWHEIADLRSRGPSFLDVTTSHGEALTIFVGPHPRVAELCVRHLMHATPPPGARTPGIS